MVRKALYGGRTNAVRLYHKCENGEKIRYIDVTSLYPFVQKYGVFPTGHPTIITEQFDYSINKYFGIIKCTLLPPKNLYLPVIPLRINKKLVFTLCFKCAEEENQLELCKH